jgi:hypothetical protein
MIDKQFFIHLTMIIVGVKNMFGIFFIIIVVATTAAIVGLNFEHRFYAIHFFFRKDLWVSENQMRRAGQNHS